MVNNLVNNANLQAQAVVAAEGSTSVSNVIQDIRKSDSGKAVNKTEMMQRLLETGGSKDVSGQLLKDLVGKVAQAGITFDGLAAQTKVKGATTKTGLNTSEDEFSDKVEVRGKKGAPGSNGTIPVKGLGKKGSRFSKNEAEVQAKWEGLKEQLIKDGKSTEHISRMESQFKTSETKKYLSNLLKDSAILYYLDSGSKISKAIRKRGFSMLLQKAGKEVGQEAAFEARSEVEGFVRHELENELILRSHLQDGEFEDSYKLIEAGKKVGIDSVKWMENFWPQKKDDLGLSLLDVPHEVTGFIDLKDNDPNSRQRGEQEREKYEYKEADEKDLVLNRLRACYMQLALRPGAATSIKTWFKVRKLKNGLCRLGVYTQDLDDQVQSESKTLAKMKTMEMLDEALHEQASLFDPTKDKLVGSKIKNCLKNLDRLGFKLETKDFITLRDKANRHMHGLIQRELEGTKTEKKAQQLQKLLTRLRSESNLSFQEEA